MMPVPAVGPLLVGRELLLSDLLAELQDQSGLGVVLLGEAGIGKTAVAEEVLGRLDDGSGVLRIAGNAVLAQVPFGALSVHLRGLPLDDVLHPVAVMQRLFHLLGDQTPRSDELPLILVDDAHDLDESSVALLAQLISGRKARALILARPRPGLPHGLQELATDGLLASLVVEPLTFEEVARSCALIVGGLVISAASRTIALLTGGNPLFVRMFLQEASARGLLQERNGVWHLTDGIPSIGLHLQEVALADVALLGDPERQAMEYIALAQLLPPEPGDELIGRDVLRNLQEDSLVRVAGDGALSIGQPMYGEALRAGIPTARKMSLRRTVLAAWTAPARTLEELLRHTALALDAGAQLDDEVLLTAAMVANRFHDGRLALRAISAVRSPRLQTRVLVERAWAEANDGRLEEAHAIVDEALGADPELSSARDGTILSLILRTRRGQRGAEMHGDVDRWVHILRSTVQPRPQESAAAELGIVVARNVIPLVTDDGAFDPDAVTRVAAAAQQEGYPQIEGAALLLLVVDLLGAGRAAEADVLAGRAMALVTANPYALTFHDYAAGLQIMALLTAGQWHRAEAAIESLHRRDEQSVLGFSSWFDLLEGLRAIREGEFETAFRSLLLAAEGLRVVDRLHILPWVSGLAAYAALLSGDVRKARTLVELNAAPASTGARLARMLGEVYTATVTAVLAADPQGPEILKRLATTAEEKGLPLVAATALDQALILGDRTVFERLASLTGAFNGREQQLLDDFARSGAASSAEGLVEAGDAALAAGYRPLAAGCYERAREVYEKRRNQGSARAAQRKFATVSASMDGASNPRALSLPASVRLTPRELAVVNLALEGLANKEIADRQGTSVRTVEGHLYRIYTKFGISSRDELRLFMPDQ